MNYDRHDPQHNAVPHDVVNESDALYDDELSVRKIARALWWYRRVITAALVAVAIVGAAIAGWIYLRQPVERQATIEFRMVFDGADKGEYPNGLKFSYSEVIGAPVLTEVFENNKLSRYCTYDEFKNSFFIQETNREIELLGYEYRARLADPKLSPVDRARIEEEFRERLEGLRVPEYRLTFLAPATASPIPDVLLSKLLNDVLSTWADHAATRRGVLKYQINLLSLNVLPQEALSSEDYLIRLDILRGKINRVLFNLEELAALPGAAVQRVGDARFSIAEIRANLTDVLRYKTEPLIGLIRGTGVSTNPAVLARYLENRLFQMRLEKEAADRKLTVLRDTLSRYMQERGVASAAPQSGAGAATGGPGYGGTAVVPQLSDSFINRLVEVTAYDTRYRQSLADRIIRAGEESVMLERDVEYYTSLLDAVRRAPAATRGAEDSVRDIEGRLKEIFESTVRAIEQGNAFYEQLSAHNLNPRTNLYTLVGAYSTRTTRAITMWSLWAYVLFAMGICLVVVPVGCYVHHYLKQEGLLKSGKPKRVTRVVESRDRPVAQEPALAVRGETASLVE
jgi:hypothetical protein